MPNGNACFVLVFLSGQGLEMFWWERRDNKNTGPLEVGGMEASTRANQAWTHKPGVGKLCSFGRISACFGALRGAPMVTDGWYTPPRHWRGRLTWQGHSICDFTMGGVHTTLLEHEPRKSILLGLSLLVLGLWEGPPWSKMVDILHPETNKVGWHDRNIPYAILLWEGCKLPS